MLKRSAIALAIAGLCGAVALVVRLGPNPPAWYPPCLFHRWTGWHCPGCGSARAVHALMDGDVIRALHHNIMLFAVVPLIAIWCVTALRRGQPIGTTPLGASRWVLISMLAFAVLRNLPWPPFVWLAPVE